jgi:hypothetical protein
VESRVKALRLDHSRITQMTRTGSMLAVWKTLDLLCVDDMISIRARVTRDIRPGTSADGG